MSTRARRGDRRPLPIFVGLLLILPAGCAGPGPADADLLIRGGEVIDGTGAPARRVDVAVRDGLILAIGELDHVRASREIDATGLVVTPGFVDMHSHADLIVLSDIASQEALLGARLRQGVTTIVTGNCGLGVAPASEDAAAILERLNGWMTPAGTRAGALDTAGYLARLEHAGVVLNVATLVPHGPVRISAMGLAAGHPSDDQLERMRQAVARGLDAGAFGLSAGLIYPPGMFSATDELVALATIVAEHDGIVAAHIRGSSETLLPATRELLEIGRRSGARVHHSHLEAVGERFWPAARQVLELEDEARSDGLRVSHDVFPYTRAATMMAAIFPPWSLEGGVPALLERLAKPAARARIRRDVERQIPDWPPWREGGWPHNLVEAVGWDGIIVASVGPDGPRDWIGRNLADIAASTGREPFDVVADLMIDQQGRVGQLVDQISGRAEDADALLSILVHPAAAVISDAEDYGRGTPHPAHAGAFPRALRLAREGSRLATAAMIHKMTGYPARLLGLTRRGELHAGWAADLVILDPAQVTDHATWETPRRPPTGIEWVVLNGAVAVEHGRYLGGARGQVLRAPEPR